MRKIVRSVAALGVAGALLPLTAATSHAAPSSKSACITASDEQTFGRGEISICPQGNGAYRVTEWTEDLLPGDGVFNGPDGACVGWEIYGAQGYLAAPVWNCPQFDWPPRDPKLKSDYVWKFKSPVTHARLGLAYN